MARRAAPARMSSSCVPQRWAARRTLPPLPGKAAAVASLPTTPPRRTAAAPPGPDGGGRPLTAYGEELPDVGGVEQAAGGRTAISKFRRRRDVAVGDALIRPKTNHESIFQYVDWDPSVIKC